MDLAGAIRDLHDSELGFARELWRLAGTLDDSPLRALFVDLARQADVRTSAVDAWVLRCNGKPWDVRGVDLGERILGAVRGEAAVLVVGRAPRLQAELSDLRRMASRCELEWSVVGRGARAAGDRQLLDLVTAGHADLVTTAERLSDAIHGAGSDGPVSGS